MIIRGRDAITKATPQATCSMRAYYLICCARVQTKLTFLSVFLQDKETLAFSHYSPTPGQTD